MKIKVLVADDDSVTRSMISRALESKGFLVIAASDGAEALSLVEKEKPEIVISDLVLPKIDGLSLCSKIKENPELFWVKVILITAVYKTSAMRTEALSHKADAYLEKPVSVENLLKTIDSLI
ncbi:MAG: response regulator [Candidatus Saccharicenans sp.]